jgi:hypothetical protein
MPYIVCTNTPGNLPDGTEPRAYATIEEARDAARGEVETSLERAPEGDRNFLSRHFAGKIAYLPEHGGVIGPLPDGYVIDVQAKSWPELAELAGVPFQTESHPGPRYEGIARDHARILDAYNDQ